jgi:hypothetical protein
MSGQPYKSIQIVSIDKKQSKEGSPNPKQSTYVFTLSSSPQPYWLSIFNQLWQARKKNEPLTPQISIDQGRLTLICSITDDPQTYINHLEEDFEIANQKSAEKRQDETDKETSFQQRLDNIRFKNKT